MTREELVQTTEYWRTLYENECERLGIEPTLLFVKPINEEEQRKQREEYAERMMAIHCIAHHIDSPNHIIKDALRIAYDEGYKQALSI